MKDQDREKAMADKDAILEMVKTEGWQALQDSLVIEEARLVNDALRADEPIKCFALMREVRGIRNFLQQLRWIDEKGTKAEKEAH